MFDLNATLLDTQAAGVLFFHETAQSLGVPLTDKESDQLALAWRKGPIAQHQFFTSFSLSRGLDRTMFEAAHDRMFLEHVAEIDLMPGVPQVLETIARTSKLGLVTDCNVDYVTQALSGRGLELFDAIVAHEEVLTYKPNSAGYRLCLRKLAANPRRSIAVEDSQAGVRAARGAGLYVIGTRAGHADPQPLDEAHDVIEDMGDLFGAIEQRGVELEKGLELGRFERFSP